jgi:hypothetical protein
VHDAAFEMRQFLNHCRQYFAMTRGWNEEVKRFTRR